MPKITYFINNHGSLKRKDNNIYFLKDGEKIVIPIEKLDTIISFSKLSLSSGAISLLSKKRVAVHFFNKYGFYRSSLYPLKRYDGKTLINQVLNFIDYNRRLYISKKIVEGSSKNILSNLKFYYKKGKDVGLYIEKINGVLDTLHFQDRIDKLMSIEGNIRNLYYQSFSKFLPEDFKFVNRTKNPPKDMINCMISFGNSLLYSTITNEIYKTSLNPSVSFLHEPKNNISLSLDISEIFKPIIVDRLIFKLINKNIIQKDCFNFGDGVFLNKKGRNIFLSYYSEKLDKKIRIDDRKISYKNIIAKEIRKIIDHINGKKIYEPLVV